MVVLSCCVVVLGRCAVVLSCCAVVIDIVWWCSVGSCAVVLGRCMLVVLQFCCAVMLHVVMQCGACMPGQGGTLYVNFSHSLHMILELLIKLNN